MIVWLMYYCRWNGIVVWTWVCGCCRENNGETRHSRPSDLVSPRRDL